uniref:Rho-GAP domain-containing protein n=1 Tax=Arcella intermedia TaxID=1963864 RepID=A0A6B2LBT0_9EUKA
MRKSFRKSEERPLPRKANTVMQIQLDDAIHTRTFSDRSRLSRTKAVNRTTHQTDRGTVPKFVLQEGSDLELIAYPHPVFGVRLEELSTPQTPIPYFIKTTLQYLLTDEAILTTGVLRVSGSMEDIFRYQQMFDMGKEVNFSALNASVHDVAGLLKLFFRKLPEPLIPELYNSQVYHLLELKNQGDIDEKDLMDMMRDVILQLPKENLEIFRVLVEYLGFVVAKSSINSMPIENIMKCIVPTIGCAPLVFYYPILQYQFFFSETNKHTRTDEEATGTRHAKRNRKDGHRKNF